MLPFDKAAFGAKLYALRKNAKLSQEKAAEILGVTHTQISDMEKGKPGTTLDKLLILCDYYKVSSDYLLGITDDPAWRGPANEP